MKSFALVAVVAALSASAAFAQSPEATVNFTMNSDMQSLKNKDRKDSFKIVLADAQQKTDLDLSCQAGSTKLMIMRTARGCSVTGKGTLTGPGGKTYPRTQYLGGVVTEADGRTDATNVKVSYLAVGKVPASSGQFGGTLNLKPELTSTGAAALKDKVLQKIDGNASGLIDQRVDTIDLNKFATPSGGLPSDKGCSWSGNMVYAYQTESWYMDLVAQCANKDNVMKEFKLKGNMPYTAETGPNGEAQYHLTLTLPGAGAGTDEALFAADSGDGDLFATVDGITGVITMNEGNNVTIKVDGADEEVPSTIDATGTFTGTNVPIELVRSFATVISINASGFFGG
ncbi:MAG: hypothetical protein EOP20_11170 [Hyphomicrobiales bacterium]|nr:MAG: hypothetical protein EOP20_11170 [Hyphomicrobiales bacterium]